MKVSWNENNTYHVEISERILLCLRCILGNMSQEEMMEYGIGPEAAYDLQRLEKKLRDEWKPSL